MSNVPQLFRLRFHTMGCPAELGVYAHSGLDAQRALDLVRHEVDRLDQKYSHYRPDSQLALIEARAGRPNGVRVDRETASLLNFAACQHRLSGGRFDITAGYLTRLWEDPRTLPTASEIDTALAKTGWQKVRWDGSRLELQPGMRLNLGAVVKEYAADRVALLLRQAGFLSGYVDLGGDLHMLGPHLDGQPWKVGIRHPRKGGAMAQIDLHRGGIASSGDYERYRMVCARRYSHIIDARTGWPVQGLASVSVVAPSCLVAGAVSTLAMLYPAEEALNLLEDSGLAWLAHDGIQAFAGDGLNSDQTAPVPKIYPCRVDPQAAHPY